MRELINNIAIALVDNPEHVEVSEIESNHTSFVELSVAKSDIGKVIGRQGRTVQALRTILSAVSAKSNKKALLEIIE